MNFEGKLENALYLKIVVAKVHLSLLNDLPTCEWLLWSFT